MIDVYTANTPNGIKIPIALEEMGIPYRIIRVDLTRNEQNSPDFLNLNPNARIPAIVDTEAEEGALSVFESGAILLYLTERYGKLIPDNSVNRVRMLEYLFLQVAGLGPTFGQAGYFLRAAPDRVTFAIERYQTEARRLIGVLDKRLKNNQWLAGEDYTIADIAHFGWLRNPGYAGVDLDNSPHVQRWATTIAERSEVQRGLAALA